MDGRDLIKCYGFNVLETQLAKTGKDAADFAEDMGFPVVMKIVSPQILHKSDAGGVVIGLESKEAVFKTFDKIVERALAHKPVTPVKEIHNDKQIKISHLFRMCVLIVWLFLDF